MAGITQKSCVAAFPLWSLQKENRWVKGKDSKMQDIIGISIAYWRIHLTRARKIRFTVKIEL